MSGKLYTTLLIVFCAAVVGFALHSFYFHENTTPVSGASKQVDRIEYSIFSTDGQHISGNNAASKQSLLLEKEKLQKLGAGPITYDFSLTSKQTPKISNVRLVLDEKANVISLRGNGLEKFSEIELSHGRTNIKAKADWAGKFQHISPFDFSSMKPGKIERFQLAFQGMDFSLGNGKSIKFLDVLFAPGGGKEPIHTWQDPDASGLLPPNPENNIYDLTSPDTVTIPEYPSVGPGKAVKTFDHLTGFHNIMYFETYCGDPEISVCHNANMGKVIVDIVENYVTALMKMTEQLTASMMQHVQMVGMMLDAKSQLETQRETQALVASAHKSYHPSEQMCMFGTFVRNLANTQEHMAYNALGFNKAMMSDYIGTKGRSTAEGYAVDIEARAEQFKTTYCRSKDNLNTLDAICDPATDPDRRPNMDIDFNKTFDTPLTIDVDFADQKSTPTEQDVLALARNLYWPKALEGGRSKELSEKYSTYVDIRNLAAVNGVAHNSFAQIMAMKSREKTPDDDEDTDDEGNGSASFMFALLKEFGMSEEEAKKFLGEYPSYYAQMEVLTKKVYQNPDFYTNLYDKPDNVKRMGVSMDAITLMQSRDRFESSLRREMLLAMMVEQALAKHVEATNSVVGGQNANLTRDPL